MPENPITWLTLVALLILGGRELVRYRAEHQAEQDKKDLIPIQRDADDTKNRNEQFRDLVGVIASQNDRFDRFLDIAARQTDSLDSNTLGVASNTQSLETLSHNITTIMGETASKIAAATAASVEALGIRIDVATSTTNRLIEEKVAPMNLQLDRTVAEMQTVQTSLSDLQQKLDAVIQRLDTMDAQDRTTCAVLNEVLTMSQQASEKIDDLLARRDVTHG